MYSVFRVSGIICRILIFLVFLQYGRWNMLGERPFLCTVRSRILGGFDLVAGFPLILDFSSFFFGISLKYSMHG